MIDVRPFSRSDRDQLVRLANAHIGAIVPGWAVPTATLLSQLERDRGDYVVDPWVTDRATVVAIEHDRLVAAAHLRRYAGDARVDDGYRDAGEITWSPCFEPAAGAEDVEPGDERLDGGPLPPGTGAEGRGRGRMSPWGR